MRCIFAVRLVWGALLSFYDTNPGSGYTKLSADSPSRQAVEDDTRFWGGKKCKIYFIKGGNSKCKKNGTEF